MTIPKKGSRKITVNDLTYRWSIRHKPTPSQEKGSSILASVELYLEPGCSLSIEFPWVRFDNLVEGTENARSITPKIIQFCIKDALKKGWNPEKKGPTFEYFY